MSRIGRQPIPVPDKVEVKIEGRDVSVEGPNGIVSGRMPEGIGVSQAEGEIVIERPSDAARDRALHGLTRSLIANMVEGVTDGFMKKLEIVGVGYRAEAAGNNLKLALGFSHPIEYPVPEGVDVTTPQPTQIEIRGADKQKVGQVAAEIRAFRPAEPYKGKGVKYEGEHIRRKAGKTGV